MEEEEKTDLTGLFHFNRWNGSNDSFGSVWHHTRLICWIIEKFQ